MEVKAAGKLILRHEDAVLLACDRRGVWDFPGGGADPGERLPDAIRREMTEETGMLPDGYTFNEEQVVHVDEWDIEPKNRHVVAVFYAGSVATRSEAAISNEHSAIAWHTRADVRSMTMGKVTPDTIRALDSLERLEAGGVL